MRIARKRFKPEPVKIKVRFNDMIRVPEVRVIDENGEHVGVMRTEEALRLAKERELDLIEINPEADPPVVKILEYGQFKYQKDKEERLQKKKQKETEVKGVRLSLRIGEHDKTLRLNQAKGFFEDGNKVKVEIILRGRERQFVENAFKVVKGFIEELHKQSPLRVEQAPTKQENKIIALLAKA
ncbi:MAG: translation initiation factor IF-3 [Candidatus Magasanikbacteria bacterium RIFCSPHIGHO2_01_FULL_50_8]|uniref:Translation initiation factor IF-3 n=2 Tax=Candidatus Magasanikiibacteriota TaxID=1752731 RepID=A0A1F6LRC6_9BACT|nr:MAG: translation initiation factor IF-3 [Candidatus Magasanikbacteria bacterium RIFCSPHIGHO2_01_FULL_50_8]OGH67945.1 MAG: translation initiation factor IF-3 [Candidatus Magasanikbacteria bacterium RIFCSPHIGHO2_02_FULL_50_9b]